MRCVFFFYGNVKFEIGNMRDIEVPPIKGVKKEVSRGESQGTSDRRSEKRKLVGKRGKAFPTEGVKRGN